MTTNSMTIFQKATLPVLLVGPLFSMYVVAAQAGGTYIPSDATGFVLAAILLFWSPMPFSVPALIMSTARDTYLPKEGVLTRAIGLLPYLHRHSMDVRAQLWASLSGFLLGAVFLAKTLM